MTGNREKVVQWLLSQPDGLYDIEPHKKNRSLSADRFYWQVVGLIAKEIKQSNSYIHNTLLQKYGEPSEINGSIVEIHIPDTEEAITKAMEATTYHLYPTSRVSYDGIEEPKRVCLLLKGSSEMNTAEFSRLLDGALEEARLLDVRIPEVQYER